MEFTGSGGLVYFIAFLQAIAQAVFTHFLANSVGTSIWAHLAFGAAGAVVCFFVGRHENRELPPAIFDYKKLEDGKEGADGHTFFFVRMEYGGLVTIPMSLLAWVLSVASLS